MPDDESTLPPGKVPPSSLERLLGTRPQASGEIVGPGIGLDGAVLRLPEADPGSDGYLVAASDPITFAADEIGWYAVHVNANDVACMGARPTWFLATVLLPPGAGEGEVAAIFRQIEEACSGVGAGLVGGHTEVTPGLDRPIVAGTMLGVTERWISAAGAEPGDSLLLTKGVAVEGTAILAREAASLLEGAVEPDLLERARGFLRDPGLSVVADARAALEAGRVHALHDPTEGGLVNGIHELCRASGTGAVVDLGAVPVFDETRAIATALEIDPLGLIASGALLVAAPAPDAEAIVAALEGTGIAAARIGRLTDAREDKVLASAPDGSTRPLRPFDSDELTRVL